MTSKQAHVFTLMVDNEFGVLTRITALIRRAGWNIRSLAVAETALPEVSRLTVSLECRHHSFETVLERLGRQSCVREITAYTPEAQAGMELAILRMGPRDSETDKILREHYGATPIHNGEGPAMYSLPCEAGLLDAWLPELKKLGLRDIARTGTVALRRHGEEDGDE